MTHPIPGPRSRPPLEPLAKRPGARGPHCPACEHPSCRRLRARNLPLLGGHRAVFLPEHRHAAALQAHPSPATTLSGHLRRSLPPYPHLVVWFGEALLLGRLRRRPHRGLGPRNPYPPAETRDGSPLTVHPGEVSTG